MRLGDRGTQASRYDIVRISPNSWLGRNRLYVQSTLFFMGLVARILFINSDRWALGSFLIGTIVLAIVIGYLYAGKSWCQYFCPMAPVQTIYTGPRSLLGSQAHTTAQATPQSMCRTLDPQGNERSACVACKANCVDIDAEKSYWKHLYEPGRQLTQYAYVGMVIAFYLYYYLYAGNWDYYFSGSWTHEQNQVQSAWDPGFYIAGHSIAIPKFFAVPLTFLVIATITYFLGCFLEKSYRRLWSRPDRKVSEQQARHVLFTLTSALSFWIFFSYGARPNLNLLPDWLVFVFNASVISVGVLWAYRTLDRSEPQYNREAVATSLKQQLSQMDFDFSSALEGRTLESLSADEVYALYQVIPEITHFDRQKIYKGILREVVSQRLVTLDQTLAFFESLRQQLKLTTEAHWRSIDQLQQDFPQLFYVEIRK